MSHPHLHVSYEELERSWDVGQLEEALAWCELEAAIRRADED